MKESAAWATAGWVVVPALADDLQEWRLGRIRPELSGRLDRVVLHHSRNARGPDRVE
jgi:hypothetical protein